MQPQNIETDLARSNPEPPSLRDEPDLELEAWLASAHWPPSTAPAVDDDDYQDAANRASIAISGSGRTVESLTH